MTKLELSNLKLIRTAFPGDNFKVHIIDFPIANGILLKRVYVVRHDKNSVPFLAFSLDQPADALKKRLVAEKKTGHDRTCVICSKQSNYLVACIQCAVWWCGDCYSKMLKKRSGVTICPNRNCRHRVGCRVDRGTLSMMIMELRSKMEVIKQVTKLKQDGVILPR